MNSIYTHKKALILINHNTAAKFFCDIFQECGYDTYIPLICTLENGLLTDDKAKKYRTLNNQEFVQALDTYDFYKSNNTNIEYITNIISDHFDIIITLYTINKKLSTWLSICDKRVYFIIWGDDCSTNLYESELHINNNILNYPNKYYLFTHSFLLDTFRTNKNIPLDKIQYAPLSCPKYMDNYYNSVNCNYSDLKVVIITSRLCLNNYDTINERINVITKLAIALSAVTFHIVGKSNNTNKFQNLPNVIIHPTFDLEIDLYTFIKQFPLTININYAPYILQYSSMETACINIPMLYKRDSTIDKILQYDNYMRFEDQNDLINKVKELLINQKLSSMLDISRKNNDIIYQIYKFDNCIKHFRYMLNNQIELQQTLGSD